MNINRRSVIFGFGALGMGAALTACGVTEPLKPKNTLKIVAGSEIKDITPIFDQMAKDIDVTMDITYMGTIEGTESLSSQGREEFVGSWFPSNNYMRLLPNADNLIDSHESIMQSPVVLGMRKSEAERLGWSEKKSPTWDEIIARVEAGELTYGMTSPISSNSGFSTLLAAATALSGTGSALTSDDVNAVKDKLRTLAGGQKLAAGSSGWLMDSFMENPQTVHGIFNYESLLRTSQINGENLVIVTPSNGIITSDYPLTKFKGISEEDAQKFNKVMDYLRTPDVQSKIAEMTARRTSTSSAGGIGTVFEIAWPAQVSVVKDLLSMWVSQARKPSLSAYVMDTSGSMQGESLASLKTAVGALSGATAAVNTSDTLLTLQPREKITVVEFGDKIKNVQEFSISENPTERNNTLSSINTMINNYVASGGTAIYDSLVEAMNRVADARTDDVLPSVVLFTDGENTDGRSFNDFKNEFHANERWVGIPVYPIVFGGSNKTELENLASLTGGKTFNGDKDLTKAFREIRGYQ